MLAPFLTFLVTKALHLSWTKQTMRLVQTSSLDPPLVAMYDGSSYELIGRKQTTKLQCSYFAMAAESMSRYLIHGVIPTTSTSIQKRHSKMRQHSHLCHPPQFHTPCHVHYNPSMTSMKAGKWKFHLALIPPVTEPQTCEHGHQFSQDDPVSNGWIPHHPR